MRPRYHWRLRTRSLLLGERTLLMGVVNVTPDSFSERGQHFSKAAAVARGLRLLDEGADILDIGGESTRPGAKVGSVSEEEELSRVVPVITELLHANPKAVLSVDTYKSAVALAAVEAGAEIVNDVSALRWDPNMASTLAELKCGVVMMHMRGLPQEWRKLPRLTGNELLSMVLAELELWTGGAIQAGVSRESIVIDPGFGFGKNFEENYPLLARLADLQSLGLPVLAGTSRKSFVGRMLARDGQDAPIDQRLFGTLATVVVSILQGAHIVRVHDLKPARDAAYATDALLASAG